MFDLEQIKNDVDCRDLVERDLGKPKYRSSRYNTYKCPLHHEENGYSLVVYDDHWHCFGKCGHGGDAISWLEAYHNLSFQEACERLTNGHLPHKPLVSSHIVKMRQDKQGNPPDELWQKAAFKVKEVAMETLWGKTGERAWSYLQEKRGLSEKTIVGMGLGYIPGHYHEWKRIEGLNVPCGITIPWIIDGAIWGIKVRRAGGDIRYQQVAGGNIKGGLYLADRIVAGRPVMVTEGEFDALIVQQAGEGLISAVAIGSAANKHIHPRWLPKFLTVPSILIRMDDDEAGQGAAAQIAGLSQASWCIQVPQGKDVNEFYLLAGYQAVRDWIIELIGGDEK